MRTADVLVENFRLGSLARLGLEPQRLATLNPRLVRVSISGFGRTGPEADVPGYDLTVQAAGGIMSITGEAGGPPMKVGVAITDVLTGLYSAVSAAGGTVRSRSARDIASSPAASFDLALADCTLSALVNVARRLGDRPAAPSLWQRPSANRSLRSAGDSRWISRVGDRQRRPMEPILPAAECEYWSADPRFATNPARVAHREELIPQLTTLLAGKSTSEWLALCAARKFLRPPVRALDEVLATPQVAARGMVAKLTDAAGRVVPVVASPIHADGNVVYSKKAPPELGEHTTEVLEQWLGYDAVRIKQLRQRAIVA